MNTKLFELKPCPQCKGTGDAHHQGHDYDCGDCLGTGFEEPAKRIMNLELMLKQHKEALKSSDAHNNELAQKLEIAWEQRDEALEKVATMVLAGDYNDLFIAKVTGNFAARAEIDRLKDHCRTKVEALQNQTAERMKAEQQRIAIADAAGFIAGYSWSRSDGIAVLPNYLNDLNAMHAAFLSLPAGSHITFGRHLQEVCGEGLVGYVSSYPEDFAGLARIAHATAAQRAEAFLKTIGKWTTNQNEL
jgi:hypothetical protein